MGGADRQEKKLTIVEGLARISKKDLSIKLTPKEKAQFEKAVQSEDGVGKITFQFGNTTKSL